MISIFFVILGVIAIPFTSYTEISLKSGNLKKRSVAKIYKKNLLGITNILLDMKKKKKINRIVFKQSGDKVFITFRENIGDVVPLGSPIFVVDLNNKFQLNGIEEMLVDFISYANHEIKIEKIYSNSK